MRDETKILDCGCKIGRSTGGHWYYDYFCEIHVMLVYDEKGHYSFEKAEELTRKLNREMKQLESIEKRQKEGKTITKVEKGITVFKPVLPAQEAVKEPQTAEAHYKRKKSEE